MDELIENLGYEKIMINLSTQEYNYSLVTPTWGYNNSYYYWTMSSENDSETCVYSVITDGSISAGSHVKYANNIAVRPVIVLPKSAL